MTYFFFENLLECEKISIAFNFKGEIFGLVSVVLNVSSICVSRAGGGGRLKTLCIKIGYNEPIRAESREGS